MDPAASNNRVPITDDHRPPLVISDNGRHSAILLELGHKWASLIAMNSRGLRIKRIPITELRAAYHAVPEYPLERAARIYLHHAELSGGTDRALEALTILSQLFSKEITKMSATKPSTSTKRLSSSDLRADSPNKVERATYAQLKAEEAAAANATAGTDDAAKAAFAALFKAKSSAAKAEKTQKSTAASKKAEKPAAASKKAEKPAAAPKKTQKPAAAPKKAEKPAAALKKAEKHAAASKKAEKHAAAPKEKGAPRSKMITPEARIKILAKENPKRAGSRSAEIFDAYKNTKGEGRTVAEVLKRFPEYEDYVYASLRWDVKQGFIKLEA